MNAPFWREMPDWTLSFSREKTAFTMATLFKKGLSSYVMTLVQSLQRKFHITCGFSRNQDARNLGNRYYKTNHRTFKQGVSKVNHLSADLIWESLNGIYQKYLGFITLCPGQIRLQLEPKPLLWKWSLKCLLLKRTQLPPQKMKKKSSRRNEFTIHTPKLEWPKLWWFMTIFSCSNEGMRWSFIRGMD